MSLLRLSVVVPSFAFTSSRTPRLSLKTMRLTSRSYRSTAVLFNRVVLPATASANARSVPQTHFPPFAIVSMNCMSVEVDRHAKREIRHDRFEVVPANANAAGWNWRRVLRRRLRIGRGDHRPSVESELVVVHFRERQLSPRNYDWNRIGTDLAFRSECSGHLAKDRAVALEIDLAAVHRYREVEI